MRHGLINLGGDIRIVGPQADGRPWPIGIVHPLRTDAAIATLSLAEGAVTTSGGYERFVEIEGRRYGHLIDPRNGWPADGLLSVSVVASQAVVAGSIATVALLQPPAEGLDWLERCRAPYLAVDPAARLPRASGCASSRRALDAEVAPYCLVIASDGKQALIS